MESPLSPQTKPDPLERDLTYHVLAHEFSQKLGIQNPVFKRYTGQHKDEQAKYIQIRFDEKQIKQWGFIEIYQLTDCQFGHVCCREDKLQEFVKHILEKENRFIAPTGDLIDAAHIGSPGGPQENKWKPQGQLSRFCYMFAPVAHRMLGYVSGNHEQRQMLYFGDLGTLISMLLRVPFSSGQQNIDIHFGKHKPYRMELWHGKGAARTPGAKLNMLVEHMVQNPDADIVLVGHLHDSLRHRRWIKTPDAANMSIQLREQLGAMSSSFLDFWGNYGEVKGMSPTGLDIAKITLYSDGRVLVNA